MRLCGLRINSVLAAYDLYDILTDKWDNIRQLAWIRRIEDWADRESPESPYKIGNQEHQRPGHKIINDRG